ncbi:MAG TPA: hypothetical protein VHE99_03670 [Gammaproteobacteria bacterium]|nr:hypothetical protein [Gammaproteobacteria bacterium]
MRKLQLSVMVALLSLAATGFAETTLTLEITNTGWETPLYTKVYSRHVNTLLDKSFLFTELSPQMKKVFSLVVGRYGPPPPEKIEVSFFDNPDLQGEPVAKWGYFDEENPITGKWESRLCDFRSDSFVSCFYTGDAKNGYFVYVTVDGDYVSSHKILLQP